MSAQLKPETCPRCGIQRPFYCDCEDTFDLNGASLTVAGLGKVDARERDSDGFHKSEYFVLLKLKSESMNFAAELELSPEAAYALAEKIHAKAVEMATDDLCS